MVIINDTFVIFENIKIYKMKKIVYINFILFSLLFYSQDCSVYYQYALGDRFYIKIPDCLEYQDGIMKKNNDYYHQRAGYSYDDKVVFQRRGMNDSYLSVRQPNYEKVFYEMHKKEKGTYRELGSAFTSSEIKTYSNEILQPLKSTKSVALLKWDKPNNVKIGHLWALKVSYVRKIGGNDAVRNTTYFIQDNDRIHMISCGYRLEIEEIWKPIMIKTILSLEPFVAK